ncbi:putative F-box protein At3g52320 [Silene latifolia]|uniref:putative F-box protein At3g52320 n=1 Tax=Silene latifolia TaxID=37657 RepID=UPI003D783508
MVKLWENHAPNSAKFGRECSKTKQERMVGGYFDRLPCEILHSIALMLPFASIIQLSRSSKFWYNCLINTSFVDLQLTHALQKSPVYLFTANDKNQKNYEMFTVEESGDHLTTSKIFRYGHNLDFQIQSSGGLICVPSRESRSFRIFNPHIGQEVKVLDVPKFKECSPFTSWFFSYSPSTKEYKILKIEVSISKDETSTRGFVRNVAMITTLGSNVWQEIQNVPPDLSIYDSFTECQGTLFWVTKSGFVSFDIVSEKFHEIPGSPHDPVDHGRYVSIIDRLISMGDTVGYVRNNRLWVLEDKTKGIWINKYDFSISQLGEYASGIIGTSENGGLFGFIENSTSVFRLDTRRTHFSAIEIIRLDKYVGEKAPEKVWFTVPHVSSLVSPVRVMQMGNKVTTRSSGQQIYDHSDLMDICLRRKFETLKLDDDASEDDLFNTYKLNREYDDQPKLKRRKLTTTG